MSGIGGDFDGCGICRTVSTVWTSYPNLLEELADRGWSDADLAEPHLAQRAAGAARHRAVADHQDPSPPAMPVRG